MINIKVYLKSEHVFKAYSIYNNVFLTTYISLIGFIIAQGSQFPCCNDVNCLSTVSYMELPTLHNNLNK